MESIDLPDLQTRGYTLDSVEFDRYASLLYGVLLKATNGNEMVAGELLLDIFSNHNKDRRAGKSHQSAILSELLTICAIRVRTKNIRFDVKQYCLSCLANEVVLV